MQPEDQAKQLAKYENAKKKGSLFIDLISERLSKYKNETKLNVAKMIEDGNPNVATAIIYNEGFKACAKEVYEWLTQD